MLSADSFRLIPRLPQELVDHIIDHLYDDFTTLNSCSLVSHAWRPTSLFHIFSKLSLKVTPVISPSELCQRLYRLLSSSPSIRSYIRELDVLEGSQLGTQVAPHVVLAGSQSVIWVANDRWLPRILRKLTHLKRLDFGAQSATIQWSRMQLPAQSAIRQMLSLSSLTYVRLAFWNFTSFWDLSSLISCCKNLQDLTLSNVTFGQQSGYPVDLPDTPPVLNDLQEEVSLASETRRCRLHFLTVEHVNSAPFGDWLLGPESSLDLTSLRELRVALFNDIDFVKRLVARAGSSLEHFHFKMGESDPRPFDLSTNYNLHSMKLTLEDAAVALSWVMALLGSISTTNSLENICLEFYTPLKDMTNGWEALDALFSREEFNGLKQVDIGLFALSTSPEYIRVTESLAGLSSRGIVRFYRLGLKGQRSNHQLTPRISRYDSS
ncbi:hypothetical protein H2248_005423 [Termitomyces sp. 'cryptogamus']|nr:hypothetical protein H2248_005423 [Termitomyces sp. 'cryptogamus']